jgi:hypothetical protein
MRLEVLEAEKFEIKMLHPGEGFLLSHNMVKDIMWGVRERERETERGRDREKGRERL